MENRNQRYLCWRDILALTGCNPAIFPFLLGEDRICDSRESRLQSSSGTSDSVSKISPGRIARLQHCLDGFTIE